MDNEVTEGADPAINEGKRVEGQPSVDSILAAMTDVISSLSDRIAAMESSEKAKMNIVEKTQPAQRIKPVITPKEGASVSKTSDKDIAALSFSQLNRLRYGGK